MTGLLGQENASEGTLVVGRSGHRYKVGHLLIPLQRFSHTWNGREEAHVPDLG